MDHIQVPVMELSGGPYMDLSKLLALGGDSHVLQALACIDDDTSCLRCLREVSKEIGRYALLALSKYTLTLKGGDKDTNVSGASLLQQAKLRKLEVHLRLTSELLVPDRFSLRFSDLRLQGMVCKMRPHLAAGQHSCTHVLKRKHTHTSQSMNQNLLLQLLQKHLELMTIVGSTDQLGPGPDAIVRSALKHKATRPLIDQSKSKEHLFQPSVHW